MFPLIAHYGFSRGRPPSSPQTRPQAYKNLVHLVESSPPTNDPTPTPMTTTKIISNKIIKAIEQAPLSATSRAQYLRRLEILAENGAYANIWTAITSHEASIVALLKKYENRHASLHMYSTSVLAAFKHVPSLKELAPESYTAWLAVHEAAQRPLELHTLTAQPTERQAHGWIPFDEIVAKRESLPIGSDARLLISIYTEIPSRRNDFAKLRIYTEPPPEGTGGNYLVMPPQTKQATVRGGMTESAPSILTLTEYKTSKKYNTVSEELPGTLVVEIRTSLVRQPREYLFVSPRDGSPYNSEGAFSKWANALLRRTFGKPLTLTLIRHAFVTNLKFDEMTHGEKQALALRMGHSVDTQSRYKFLIRDAALATV